MMTEGGAGALRVHLVGLVAYSTTALLGRLTVPEGSSLALFWPAAGVAAVWLLACRERALRGGLGLLVLATALVNLATGGTIATAATFAAVTFVQGLAFVLLARRLAPGHADLRTSSPVVVALGLVNAALVASALGVVVGSVLLSLGGAELDVTALVVWWGRTFSAIVAVGSMVYLFLRRRARMESLVMQGSPRELLGLVGVSVAVYAIVFAAQSLPLTFLPVMLTLWAGLRCSAAVAVLHSVLASTAVVVLTALGRGPFAGVGTDPEAAVALELFVAALLVKALLLVALRSERETATMQLRLERERAGRQAALLQSAVGSVREGLVVLAPGGDVLTANAAAREMLAWPDGQPASLATDFPVTGLDGAPVPWEETPVARGLRGESVRDEQVGTLGADGRRRRLSLDVEPLGGSSEQLLRPVVVVVRDVTEEVAQVEELRSFAGSMAHDLRGSLGVVGNWAELAQRMARGEDGDEVHLDLALSRLRAGVLRLDDMLDTMLEHALSQDGEAPLEAVDLGELVREVAAARGAEDRVVCDPLPGVVGDVALLRQLVDNLLGNAVKFAAPGVPPRVRVTAEPRGDRVEVGVADNGIGVPPDLRARVFERFERGVGDEVAGTGLGLWLCRSIVERHGGRIAIEQGLDGRGTCVRFDLPAQPAPVAS